jgi:hypothetical protein
VKSEGDDQPNANERLGNQEKYRLFGYGEPLPPTVRKVLQEFDDRSRAQRSRSSVTPVKVVARMITDRPIRPTSAR